MNSFGRNFRFNIFGESHGPMVGITIDGCLPGISISESDFLNDLSRRKGGVVAGTTSRTETDKPIFLSGVFNGFTTGAPLTIAFENNNTQPKDYDAIRAIPRPGHADFVATKKFNGFEDYRGGGHFSGRLTVCLVAAGVVAKKMIEKINVQSPIQISAEIMEVGGEADVEKAIETAIKNQDSIGGIIGCKVKNLPIGTGSPFFDSIESLISHAVFSIPAIKGIEFGSGFSAAKMKGSEHNDSIINETGATSSNHAGGISGGLSNGNDIEFRVVVKPTSSTPKLQESYNIVTNQIEPFAIKGRHDLCIALRVPPVLEAVTALVVVDLLMVG
jgi:chorismate synthase